MGVRWSDLYLKQSVRFCVSLYDLGGDFSLLDREGDLSWVPKFQSVNKRSLPRH